MVRGFWHFALVLQLDFDANCRCCKHHALHSEHLQTMRPFRCHLKHETPGVSNDKTKRSELRKTHGAIESLLLLPQRQEDDTGHSEMDVEGEIWKATKDYLNQRGTKIRVFRVCFRTPFLPPFFPHFSPSFPFRPCAFSYHFSPLHLPLHPSFFGSRKSPI